MASYLEGSHTGVPISIATRTAAPLVIASAHFNKADDENVQAALAALPGILDRLDGFISDGVIGNEEPNAADFQIAPSIGLALTVADLKPAIEKPADWQTLNQARAELSRRHAARPAGRMAGTAQGLSVPASRTSSS